MQIRAERSKNFSVERFRVRIISYLIRQSTQEVEQLRCHMGTVATTENKGIERIQTKLKN